MAGTGASSLGTNAVTTSLGVGILSQFPLVLSILKGGRLRKDPFLMSFIKQAYSIKLSECSRDFSNTDD